MPLARVHNFEDLERYIKLSTSIAIEISKILPGVTPEALAEAIGMVAYTYHQERIDPMQPYSHLEFKTLFDISWKAREFLTALEQIEGLSIRDAVFNEKWPKTPFQETETYEWISMLAQRVPIYAGLFDQAKPKSGRPGTTLAEKDLLLQCATIICANGLNSSTELDINELKKYTDRFQMVPRLAREIHFFVTNKREPQKFRKVWLNLYHNISEQTENR